MRRTMALMLVLGLVLGSVATAEAAKKKKKKKKKPKKVERVVESSYEAPAVGVAPPGNGVCFRPTNSCGDIAVGPKELWVKVEIEDATGLPVAFSLGQDTDPDTFGTETDLGDYCGTTGDEAIKIERGYTIIVFPWALGISCAAVATQGTVTATLSNLP